MEKERYANQMLLFFSFSYSPRYCALIDRTINRKYTYYIIVASAAHRSSIEPMCLMKIPNLFEMPFDIEK